MRVRLLTSMVTAEGAPYVYGQIIEVPDDVAARLLATQQAEPVLEPVEHATVVPPEQAVPPVNRRRRGR